MSNEKEHVEVVPGPAIKLTKEQYEKMKADTANNNNKSNKVRDYFNNRIKDETGLSGNKNDRTL